MLRKLIALILYVVRGLQDGGVPRTKLMKALFLVDYRASKVIGRPITGVRWFKYLYGPFSKKLLDVLDILEEEQALEMREVESRHRRIYMAYRIAPRAEELLEKLIEEELDDQELRIINEVIEELRDLDVDEVKNKVYQLPEVKEADIGEPIVLPIRIPKEVVEEL